MFGDLRMWDMSTRIYAISIKTENVAGNAICSWLLNLIAELAFTGI
jgi:hypothetical protein